MTLPGFNAETSLYKTSVHYRLMGDFRPSPPRYAPTVFGYYGRPLRPVPRSIYCGPCYNHYRLCCDEFGNCFRQVCLPR
jgi:hypothetical protein